jgi:2-succinyl-5-enolpyruvyl-6-hydroxy-3-cyclohexene-1-carboxylate synthase
MVEELISAGVREAVLAPGSRNAPLSYELFEADKIGLLRLHVRIDERSAAFTALGLAKASASPVPVITTSGTAAGNLHPAVMEAWHSRVPLVIITADRPPTMINTGANQTTRQTGLFATHVREQVQLSSDDQHPRAWRFAMQRALLAATGRRTMISGPVHINAGFSEPLVPESIARVEEDYREISAILRTAPVTELTATSQTVIIAGDTDPQTGQALAALAEQVKIPVLAEPSSNARGGRTAISAYRLLLQSGLADDIEQVIVVGHATLSRPVSTLLRRSDVELIIVEPAPEWSDPEMNADQVIAAFEIADQGDSEWLERWQQADASIRPQLDELITGGPALTGPAVADLLWSRLGPDDLLFAGSSNPVRDLDLARYNPAPPTTYANRGLAGIDGSVSTTVGLGLAADQPAHALVGDLTFLHDSNGLIIGPGEPQPALRIVVANDDGGSIFATLEQGHPAQMRAFERLFGTSHGVDLSGVAGSVGADYSRVTELDQLAEILAAPPVGLEVVDVAVDRAHRRILDQGINSLAATL